MMLDLLLVQSLVVVQIDFSLFDKKRVFHCQVNRTTQKTKIAIPETIRQDKGNYKLVAENRYGKAQHVIRVEILGKNQS